LKTHSCHYIDVVNKMLRANSGRCVTQFQALTYHSPIS
jgi:hypothetical protein